MRQVIFLCDIKEESQQEAADLLGITLDNLKVRLHRARKQLKVIIEAKGYSYPNFHAWERPCNHSPA